MNNGLFNTTAKRENVLWQQPGGVSQINPVDGWQCGSKFQPVVRNGNAGVLESMADGASNRLPRPDAQHSTSP